MSNFKYVHYGHNNFDISKFEKIHEDSKESWIKPYGGLWGTPTDNFYKEHNNDYWLNWKRWCLSNEYHVERLNSSFEFSLKPNTKIFTVEYMYDIRKLHDMGVYSSNGFWYSTKMTQLEKLGYDGIEVFMNHDIYDALYGWDCDSILIFNPDCIVLE